MKTAVTGATGFVGRHLVDRLAGAGHEVTALVHRRSAAGMFEDAVTTAVGSVEEPGSLQDAFRGIQVVYHLVGIIAETRTKTFRSTVVGGTENVCAACEASGVKRIVYLSAMGTTSRARSKYHRSKYRAEQIVKSSSMDYLIVRSSIVYGPGDGFVSMLSNMIRNFPVVPVLGSGRYEFQPIFIDDLTAVLLRGLEGSESSRQTVDVGGPEALSYQKILDAIEGAVGRERPRLHIPFSLVKPMAGVLEMFLKPAPLTRDQIVMMRSGNTGDITRMQEIFGVKPISLVEGLGKYMRD